MSTELSLCKELYEASLVALYEHIPYPELSRYHIQEFKKSVVFRRWMYGEILRVSLELNHVPSEPEACYVFQRYADTIAEVMLRRFILRDWLTYIYATIKLQH